MTDSAGSSTRLQLAHSRKPNRISRSLFVSGDAGPQGSLFAQPKPGMIVFVRFPAIDDAGFVNVITSAQPAYIFEMRLAPRFDIGTLSRRVAFDLFEKAHATYVDATAALMSGNEHNEALQKISDILQSGKVDMQRPIVFLLGSAASSAASDSEILSLLAAAGKEALEVLFVPG